MKAQYSNRGQKNNKFPNQNSDFDGENKPSESWNKNSDSGLEKSENLRKKYDREFDDTKFKDDEIPKEDISGIKSTFQ